MAGLLTILARSRSAQLGQLLVVEREVRRGIVCYTLRDRRERVCIHDKDGGWSEAALSRGRRSVTVVFVRLLVAVMPYLNIVNYGYRSVSMVKLTSLLRPQ